MSPPASCWREVRPGLTRHGCDQVDIRATISDAAGPDDNADPLGKGDDPAGYGGFDDEGWYLRPRRVRPLSTAAKGGNRHRRHP
jgi:hypothetical protein